jgi:hypothetical protein
MNQMFEFAGLRFRPLEKDDLKLLHLWENDFEVTMNSRNLPLNFVSMPQLEKRFESIESNLDLLEDRVIRDYVLKEDF